MKSDHSQMVPFLSNLTTQLRSAMGSLHMAAAQLASPEERDCDPDLDAKVARIDQSCYRLLRLVKNLEVFASTCSDRPLEKKNVDVVTLVGALCDQAKSLTHLLGLQLQFVCNMPYHICAVNQGHLELVIEQLLSNALKFTPSGGKITVELKTFQGQLLLSVSDTGCGMDAANLETLFDRFLHEGLMDPPPHGLGLGLPLCRRIAEEHGGTIMAESRPGKGSRFTLSIPDQQIDGGISDVEQVYESGGFNPALLAFADALPTQAFLLKYTD